tara:strand:+ start:193 stop:315 length:123 start_codon:yes stop_codon:yes gene_type:complete
MSFCLSLKAKDYECEMQGSLILVVWAELDYRESLRAGVEF